MEIYVYDGETLVECIEAKTEEECIEIFETQYGANDYTWSRTLGENG